MSNPSETKTDQGGQKQKGSKSTGHAKKSLPGIHDLFTTARQMEATDIYLSDSPPIFKVHGLLKEGQGYPVLLPKDMEKMLIPLLSDKQQVEFENRLDLEFSLPSMDRGTTRINLFETQDGMGAACRLLPLDAPAFEQLGPVASLTKIASFPKGLVLITGETGSGKTTTAASITNYINTNFRKYIVSIADPIEFVHKNISSIVEQREVGLHSTSFATGLHSAMRSNADVIILSELNDPETISFALETAESHLVLATCNVFGGAPWTIKNLLSYFTPDQQEFVRTQLARTVRAMVWQHLLPEKDHKGLHPVMEIMLNTKKISQLIRDNEIHKVNGEIEKGGSQGMQTMKQSVLSKRKLLHSAAVLTDFIEIASLAAAFV